jgi:hypothetical protein
MANMIAMPPASPAVQGIIAGGAPVDIPAKDWK